MRPLVHFQDTRERLKTHLEHLESYGSWHFYSSLASQFAPDVCFHTTQELHKYLEQKQLQELEPLNLAVGPLSPLLAFFLLFPSPLRFCPPLTFGLSGVSCPSPCPRPPFLAACFSDS